MPRPATLPPVQQRFVQTPDMRIHYAEVETPGRPLVMLHGIGMDWRVWQAISRRLVPEFHLYMADLRGHGESQKPAHGYTIAHYAADIEDLIDRLGLEGAVLMGSSLGGVVAVAAEVPPDAVSHRILVDPPLSGGPVRDPEMFREILRLKHEPVPLLADFLQGHNPGTGRFLMAMMSEMWHQAADGVIEDMLARQDDYFAVDSALQGDESRTLLMRADPALGGVLSEVEAQRAAALLPHGSTVLVPGAGHAIHATKPVEFAQLVKDFTRQV